MKKFNIPFLLQPEGSLDCGPTCTQMILAYYGVEKSLQQLQSQLTYDEVGTTIYDNGILLLNEHLKTTAITAQPLLFSPDTIDNFKTQEDIVSLVSQKEKEEKKDTWILTSMKNYLSKGGLLQIEIPTFKHIKSAID